MEPSKFLITAEGLYGRRKQILLKEIVDKALEQAHSLKHVIMLKRLRVQCKMTVGREVYDALHLTWLVLS